MLVTLADTSARAQVTALAVQLNSLKILHARLIAERDGAETLTPPPDLVEAPGVDPTPRLLSAQGAVMQERRRQMGGKISILSRVAAQQQDQERGLKAQIAGLDAQLASLRQEADGVRKLLASGFATPPAWPRSTAILPPWKATRAA